MKNGNERNKGKRGRHDRGTKNSLMGKMNWIFYITNRKHFIE